MAIFLIKLILFFPTTFASFVLISYARISMWLFPCPECDEETREIIAELEACLHEYYFKCDKN